MIKLVGFGHRNLMAIKEVPHDEKMILVTGKRKVKAQMVFQNYAVFKNLSPKRTPLKFRTSFFKTREPSFDLVMV